METTQKTEKQDSTAHNDNENKSPKRYDEKYEEKWPMAKKDKENRPLQQSNVQPGTHQSAGNQSSGDQPSGNQTKGNRGNQQIGNQPSGNKSTTYDGGRSTASTNSDKRHTVVDETTPQDANERTSKGGNEWKSTEDTSLRTNDGDAMKEGVSGKT